MIINYVFRHRQWRHCSNALTTTVTMTVLWQWWCLNVDINDDKLASACMCSTGVDDAALCLCLFSVCVDDAALAWCFFIMPPLQVLFCLFSIELHRDIPWGKNRSFDLFPFDIDQNHENRFIDLLFFDFLEIDHVYTIIFD